MNLADKIRAEREVLASKKAIKKVEKQAKDLEVNEQLQAIENIEFAEWFLTEVDIGGRWSNATTYSEMVKKGKAEVVIDTLYIPECDQSKTKIASLIYASNPKNGFVSNDKLYSDDEFRYCLGESSINKILSGLTEMDITISHRMSKGHACNSRPIEITILSA